MDSFAPPLSDSIIGAIRDSLGAREDQISTRISDRIAYARDVSPIVLKDTFAGRVDHLPGAMVWPESTEQVAALLRWATENRVPITPYGGGSGIVGGALAIQQGVVVDMKRMDTILEIDEVSMVARVQSGINGMMLEDALNRAGWTLGHLPQSIPSSTLGGWIAHRAAGIASTRYGKMEDLVVALEVVLPTGEVLTTRNVPRSSTGPDLDQLFIGAEGTLGIVTSAELSIRPRPAERRWLSFVYPTMSDGIDAIRSVIQADYRPAIVRMYDAIEAKPLLADHPEFPENSVLLVWGSEGAESLIDYEIGGITARCRPSAIAELGDGPALKWAAHRYSTAGLVRTIARPDWIADALEITARWSQLAPTYDAMREAMTPELGGGGQVFGHVSHVYHTGANLYMIFHAHAHEGEEPRDRYQAVLNAAFTACQNLGGSLSHHHGVGSIKADWLENEHGAAGLDLLHRIQHVADPAGIMNPVVGLHAGGSHEA